MDGGADGTAGHRNEKPGLCLELGRQFYYFNVAEGEVQLGDVMTVKLTLVSSLQGMGAIEIPITAQVEKQGISEKYWK